MLITKTSLCLLTYGRTETKLVFNFVSVNCVFLFMQRRLKKRFNKMTNFFSRGLSCCLTNPHHNYFHNHIPKSPLSTITIATTSPIVTTITHPIHSTHATHHTHNRGPFSSYCQSFRVSNKPVRIDSQDFRDHEAYMVNEISKLNETLNTSRLGGGEKARNFHLSKKKMLGRDLINTLIDAGSPFLELSALTGHDVYGKAEINEDISQEELSGADVHCRISGVADHNNN